MGNKLALLEERPSGDHSSDSSFGKSSEVVSTPRMLRKRYGDNNHIIDERLYARSRLFDMLISDWGRHEDQWRWATFKNADKVIYKPIPRDRDHALYKFSDGIFPWIFASKLFQPKFQSFNKKYRNIAGLNFSAQFLDKRILNSLSLKDWIEISDSLKTSLSDDKINRAVKIFPSNVYDACGERTIKNLKRRRDLLTQVAEKYYLQMSHEVQLAGSDQDEIFSVFMSGKKVIVKIFNKKEQEIFSRIFYKTETKRIILRGLGGEDSFVFYGKSSSIKIIATGDEGKDLYADSCAVKRGKRIHILRCPDDVISSSKWRILRSTNPIAFFDRKGFVTNQVRPEKAKRK
jgi:hypothetical protein